jgi:hypothetical protein
MEEGIHLKDGGQIAKDYSRCTLVSVSRNMKGFKHLFVSDNNDSLYRYYHRPFAIDSCYFVRL